MALALKCIARVAGAAGAPEAVMGSPRMLGALTPKTPALSALTPKTPAFSPLPALPPQFSPFFQGFDAPPMPSTMGSQQFGSSPAAFAAMTLGSSSFFPPPLQPQGSLTGPMESPHVPASLGGQSGRVRRTSAGGGPILLGRAQAGIALRPVQEAVERADENVSSFEVARRAREAFLAKQGQSAGRVVAGPILLGRARAGIPQRPVQETVEGADENVNSFEAARRAREAFLAKQERIVGREHEDVP